jgi:hypothetical protein
MNAEATDQLSIIEARRRMLELTFGSCGHDLSINPIFAAIDSDRHADLGRKVDIISQPPLGLDEK